MISPTAHFATARSTGHLRLGIQRNANHACCPGGGDLRERAAVSNATQITPAARQGTIMTPSLFISHGSQMFALEPGLLGPQLPQNGRTVIGVSAALGRAEWRKEGWQEG